MSNITIEILVYSAIILLLFKLCIIIYQKLKYKSQENQLESQLENQLKSIYPNIVRIDSDDDFIKDYISEINNYETANDMVKKIEERIKELPFPIPSEPDDTESGENIIGKLGELIDEHSEQIKGFIAIVLETTASHAFQAFVKNLRSIKTIFAEKTSEHNIEAISEIDTFDFSDALLTNENTELEGEDISEDTEGSFMDDIDPFVILAKIGFKLSLKFLKGIYNAIKYQPLKKAIEGYCSEYNQIVKDSKECATQSVNNVRSTAINKRIEFRKNLPAAPYIDDFNPKIAEITQKLVIPLRKDLNNYNRKFTKLKNSEYASKPKCKTIIDDIELKINEIEEQIPSENEINNEPIQSLRNIIDIQFFENKKFHNELPVSFQDLKEVIEEHQEKMLEYTKKTNALYEEAICDIGFELNTQAQNYNEKRNEWKEKLKQKKEAVLKEKEKLGIK
jgi:hypothetical protein